MSKKIEIKPNDHSLISKKIWRKQKVSKQTYIFKCKILWITDEGFIVRNLYADKETDIFISFKENTTQNYQWFTDEPEVVNHIIKTSGFANNKFDITEWDRDTRTISDYNVSNGEVKAARTYRIKEVEKVKTKRMALALRVLGGKEVFMVDRLFSTKEEAENYFGKVGTVWPAKLANGTELSFDIPIEEN